MKRILCICMVFIALCPVAFAAAVASTDYVNAKVADLEQKIAALRNQLSSQLHPSNGAGKGVPGGGEANQVLIKKSDSDFDAEWGNINGTHQIGERAFGGVVFWIDETKTHGLVAALVDQSQSIKWYSHKWIVTNAVGNGVGAGRMNTSLIVAQQTAATPEATMAVMSCTQYAVQEDGVTRCPSAGEDSKPCYSDWYLPSAFELNQMYSVANAIDGFTGGNYWSSTEASQTQAAQFNASNGVISNALKTTNNKTRCIRAF